MSTPEFATGAPAPPLLARTREVTDPGDLLSLLPGSGAVMSWVRRGEGIVGWGEALRIETSGPGRMTEADEAWRRTVSRMEIDDEVQLPGTGAVAFGSFSFAPHSASGGALIVPEVVVGRRDGRAWVTHIGAGSPGKNSPGADFAGTNYAATVVEHDRPVIVPGIPAPAALIVPGVPAPAAPATPGQISYSPGALTPQAWQDAVAEVVTRIRGGEAEKVVLARDVLARAADEIDARHLLARLAQGYRWCWTFAVDGLLGATPELLVRRTGLTATSRVLAGTIQRSAVARQDAHLGAELRASAKDLGEHALAVDSLLEGLRPHCESVELPPEPRVLELPNVLHLATDVVASLRTDVPAPSALALASALHPTAAVGGTPTGRSTEILAEVEQMDRGRYAGPVGWIGADGDGEWGIALRSGMLTPDPHLIRLFAGCGIVADSEPTAELAESEAKLEPMRWALGQG